jgi:ribonuclease Z
MGFNAGMIDGIFITHFHSDHIDGLGELLLQRWVSKPNSEPVPVYGPEGIDTVVNGFLQAYSLDRGYRVAHHGEAVLPNKGFGAVPKSCGLQEDKATVGFENTDTRLTAFSGGLPHSLQRSQHGDQWRHHTFCACATRSTRR